MVKKLILFILILFPIFGFSQNFIIPEIIGDLDSQKLNFVIYKQDLKKYKMSYDKLSKIFKDSKENKELLIGIRFIFDCKIINISQNRKSCLVKMQDFYTTLNFEKEINQKTFTVIGSFYGFDEKTQTFIFENCEIL